MRSQCEAKNIRSRTFIFLMNQYIQNAQDYVQDFFRAFWKISEFFQKPKCQSKSRKKQKEKHYNLVRADCPFCIAENSQKDIRTTLYCEKCKKTCCKKHSIRICFACAKALYPQNTAKDAFDPELNAIKL